MEGTQRGVPGFFCLSSQTQVEKSKYARMYSSPGSTCKKGDRTHGYQNSTTYFPLKSVFVICLNSPEGITACAVNAGAGLRTARVDRRRERAASIGVRAWRVGGVGMEGGAGDSKRGGNGGGRGGLGDRPGV